MLLDADFTAKLADFGLAITRQTRKIPNKCQFRWSSPQRCANHLARNNRYEPKNDVWSFGMICYWALTAEKPYKEIEKGNMVRYELERGAVPRFNRTPELPHALVEAIQLCWVFATRDRPPMAEVCGRLARVLERDSARLGDDHPDAGPVDRQAWRALMPGKRDGARQRESSDAIRLRALDADIELLEQRREALREHYSLVTTTAEPSKTKKSTKKLLASERTAIAQRMKAEIAALSSEIEHKQERREQLAVNAVSTSAASHMNGSSASALSVSSSSATAGAATSSSHRHRRASGSHRSGGSSVSRTTTPSNLKEVDNDSSSRSRDHDDDDDDGSASGEGDASTGASDDENVDNNNDPQPLGPRTRAVVALRDEPARADGDLALVKGASIYLLHRGATAKVLNGVDVATDKHGNFPLTAVRGVSRKKEEEIARAFGLLRKRQRPKHGGSGGAGAGGGDDSDDAAELPAPVKYVASARRASSSYDGNDQSYADAMSSVHDAESRNNDDNNDSDDGDVDDEDGSVEQIETHLLAMPPIDDDHRNMIGANDGGDDAVSQ